MSTISSLSGWAELPCIFHKPRTVYYLDRAPLELVLDKRQNPSLSLLDLKKGQVGEIKDLWILVNRLSYEWILNAKQAARSNDELKGEEFFDGLFAEENKLDCRCGNWELSVKAVNHLEKNTHSVFPFDKNLFAPPFPGAEPYYLHASLVKIEGIRTEYVATQAPTSETINDFWHAVVAGGCNKIVTLVMGKNDGADACFKYWGVGVEHTVTVDEKVMGKIKCFRKERLDCGAKVSPNEEFLMHRRFRWIPSAGGARRVIHQYQYGNWPDNMVPQNKALFNQFIDQVHSQPTEGPIVVHCRAGVGRTGVFIGADSYWQGVKPLLKRGVPLNDIRLNLINRIHRLREQRLGLVASQRQLGFIIDTLAARLDNYPSDSNCS